jgi:hypothetical protein
MTDTVLRRTRRKRATRAISSEMAGQAIGPIDADTEIYGMTDGSISLIDIIGHCMTAADSRDVTMATWTAAAGSLQAFRDLCRSRAIRTLRMIVDPSFRTRKPDDIAELHAIFGDDMIRYIPIHGKFCIMTGGAFPITIRSSMNINPNSRVETYEISTDPVLSAFHLAFADEVFRTVGISGETGKIKQQRKPVSRTGGFTPPSPLF